MTNAQQFSLILGAFLPFLLAIILRRHWSNEVKASIAFFVCILGGLASCYVEGLLTLGDKDAIVSNVLIVLTTAMALYHGFWKPSGIASAVNVTMPSMPFRIVRNDGADDPDDDLSANASATPAEPHPPAPAAS